MSGFIAAIIAFSLAGLVQSPARAAELLVVSRANCPFCKAWDMEVGSIYAKTEAGRTAPLRRVEIGRLPGLPYVLKAPVIYTPTFIVLDGDVEIDRIVGYSDEAMFWGSLDSILAGVASARSVTNAKSGSGLRFR